MAHYNSLNLRDNAAIWITVVILGLIPALALNLAEGLCSSLSELSQVSPGLVVKQDDVSNCKMQIGSLSLRSLTYQLPKVGYGPTLAMTGNGGLGFDSGEGA